MQGGVRLQLADWLATSLADTSEILYSNPPPNLPDLGPHVVELDQYQNVPYSHSDFSDVYFLLDPGKPGVRSLGPDLCHSLYLVETLLS